MYLGKERMKNMHNNIVPIVFAFDDNYALPASIAIRSLLDNAHGASYDIFVLYDELKPETIDKFNQIATINWIKVDAQMFADIPTGWSGLSTYFRLVVHDLIPQYDKIIWSDVDVLFKDNLLDIYELNIDDVYWAGVKAEYNTPEMSIHNYFVENMKEFIYMPGFMLINSKKMREDHMAAKFFETIRTYDTRLKMFDLDVLNISCDKIGEIPFEYCVLENIYDNEDIGKAKEYIWLEKIHGRKTLQNAKDSPIIIHHAGGWPKIWNRKHKVIPQYYWDYLEKSPFYDKLKYFPSSLTCIKKTLYKVLSRIIPIKKLRHHCRTKYRAY